MRSMNEPHADRSDSGARRRVLSVGQCGVDHASIRRLLEREFSAEVVPADEARQALALARGEKFDLVLVNRTLDLDGSEGLAIIRELKADPALAALPVMLVTNFADYQASAIAAGAVPGFGKAELASSTTREKLSRILAP